MLVQFSLLICIYPYPFKITRYLFIFCYVFFGYSQVPLPYCQYLVNVCFTFYLCYFFENRFNIDIINIMYICICIYKYIIIFICKYAFCVECQIFLLNTTRHFFKNSDISNLTNLTNID